MRDPIIAIMADMEEKLIIQKYSGLESTMLEYWLTAEEEGIKDKFIAAAFFSFLFSSAHPQLYEDMKEDKIYNR